MTKILPFKHPNVDDYKNSPDWFKNFLQQHASFIDTMNTVLQGNVDVTNNMQAEAQQVFFQSGVPFNVSLSKLDPTFQQPTMAFMGYVADGQVVTGCNITMYNSDGTVQITCNLQGSPVGTFTGMLLLLPVAPNPGPVPLIAQPTGTPAGAPGGGGGGTNTVSLAHGALALTGKLLSGVNPTNRLFCPNTPGSSQWEKFNHITVGSGTGPVPLVIGPTGNSGAIATTPQASALVASATMSLSFFFDASASNLYLNYHHGATNSTNATPFQPSPLGETNRYYDIFTVGGTVSSGDNVAICNFDPLNNLPGSSGNLSKIQLEVGSTPTPYTDPNGCPSSGNGLPYAIGIYPGQSIPSVAAMIGRPIDVEQTYNDRSNWGAWEGFFNITSDAPAALSVGLILNSDANVFTDLATAASGGYDAHYANLATNIANSRSQIACVRIGWEMNGFWFNHAWGAPGGGMNYGNFVGAFRRLSQFIKGAAPWCLIDWCVNQGNQGGYPNIGDAYPGDDVVDIIGMDIYEQNVGSFAGAQGTNDDQSILLVWLDNFSASTHGINAGGHVGGSKKISFPEWGATNNDGGFVTSMGGWMNARANRMAYFNYWNASDGGIHGSDFGSNSNVASAFTGVWSGTTYGGTMPLS